MDNLSRLFLVFGFLILPTLALATPSESPLPPDCQGHVVDEAEVASTIEAMRLLDRDPDYADIFLALARYFPDIAVVHEGRPESLPIGMLYRHEHQELVLLLSAFARGLEDAPFARQLLAGLDAALARVAPIAARTSTPLRQIVLDRLRTASNDPEIFLRLITAEMNGAVRTPLKWSDLFLNVPLIRRLQPTVLTLMHPAHTLRPFVFARPHQIMLAQAVYGNTTTNPSDRILEIGYGSPSVLIALRSIIPLHSLTGVDIQALPTGANEGFASLGIELLQGNIPSQTQVLNRVRQRGPYAVIFGGDAIMERTPRFPFDPGVPSGEYARMLHDLCIEGGYVVLLNDFERQPYFTSDDARAAGFTVMRWNIPRRLPAAVSELVRRNSPDAPPNAGELRLFVLRRGQVNASNVRVGAVEGR